MEIVRRAPAMAHLDDDYRLPDPSPPHGQMSVDALRRELAEEAIRQEIIAAELAEQRKLESEVRRELGLQHAGPLSLCARAGLQLTTWPHHDTFPVRQGGLLHLRMPMLPEPFLEEGLLTPGGMQVPRCSVKDRIDEWYRPPWHGLSANEDALIEWARLPKKTFSGVKRKRTDETSEANKRSSEKWICDLCHVNTSGEISFMEHCAGYQHQSNVADMELAMETADPTMIATAELYRSTHRNPTAWDCSTCQVKCSGELDLKSHLNGRRHQENLLGALWGENEENERESGFQDTNLYGKKEPQLVDMNQKPTSRWTCSICQANCTSDSDLENHLRGRRHQQNVKAQLAEGNSTTVAHPSWWKEIAGNAQCIKLRCSCRHSW